MKIIIPLLAALLLAACNSSQYISYQVPTEPETTLQPPPSKLLLLHTFDASVYKNNNKRDLLASLADTLLAQMARQAAGLEAEPVFGLTPVFTSADGGSIMRLMAQHGASHAVVIREMDIYFDQTNVEVTKTESGKNREAFYDICSNIRYELYDSTRLLEATPMFLRKHHSSRQVLSGLLAAGPGIAKNKDDIYEMAVENKDRFMRKYFTGSMARKRPLFTHGAFKPVGQAVAQNDYTRAMQLSLQLTESSSRDVRVKAWYNCAVLSERLGRLADAERYLRQALQLGPLPEAMAMNRDL